MVPKLFLLENTWADGKDHDETGDGQSQCNEGNQENAASAGWEFATDDPILDMQVSLLTEH